MSADYVQRVNTTPTELGIVYNTEVQVKKNNCGIVNVSTVCVQRNLFGSKCFISCISDSRYHSVSTMGSDSRYITCEQLSDLLFETQSSVERTGKDIMV